jgi:dTDP-4-amino-4,6-dideoxygalactose transaminase
MSYNIPIFKPKLPASNQISSFLENVDSNRIYSNFGPINKRLEESISEFLKIGTTNLVSISSATMGLEAALSTVENDDNNWVCPSWTFAATPLALKRTNKDFAFIDVNEEWRLDVEKLPLKKNNILDVLPFGDSLEMERFNGKVTNLIIDAAASIANLNSLNLSNYSYPVAIIISLHATKLISSGEGGIFISNDENWVDRVRKWQNFGFDQFRKVELYGTNAKLSEYAAAVGLASLNNWHTDEKNWSLMLKKVKEISHQHDLDLMPAMRNDKVTPYWVISSNQANLRKIKKTFEMNKVQTRLWWAGGCDSMQIFSDVPKTSMENTRKLSNTTLGLPFYIDLSDNHLDKIDNLLRTALK